MTTSTTSNHLHTTSMQAVKSDHLHHLHHLPRGRWWCGGGQEGKDGGTTSTSMNRMSQPAPPHGRYHQHMTIVAGIAATLAATIGLLAPALVLATARGRQQADQAAAAELAQRQAADVRFEFRGDVAHYAKAFDDIAKAMEAERQRRTLSGEEG